MGFNFQGIVGPQNIPDGAVGNLSLRAARDGSIVALPTAQDYLARGKNLIATSATGGIALIVAATTGGHPTLWNPQGSGVIAEFKKLSLTYISGNNAPGGLYWHITTNTGATAATAAPIATFTQVAMVNALAGASVSSSLRWSPTTNTFTAAPTFYAPTGISLFTGVAATAVAPFLLEALFQEGEMGVFAGNALSLCSQAATTTALFNVGIHLVERTY